MPVKRIVISLAIGMVSLFIVLISGLTSDFVRGGTVASRSFSAFSFTTLVTFILMMSCEEYAIYKTKRELENFVDAAPMEQVEGNRLQVADNDEAAGEDTFQPMNFANFSNQH